MTRSTSTTTDQQPADEGKPAQPDVMPEPDDDQVVEAQAGAEEEPEAPAPRREDAPPPKLVGAERRADIAKLYRDMRSKAAEDAPEGGRETVDRGESPAPEPAPAPAPEPSPAPAAGTRQSTDEGEQDLEITLKVDGKEVRKKLSEVKALAQIGLAGENRLDEVKRLLQEAKALRGQPAPEHQPAPAAQGQPHQPSPAPSQTEPRSAAQPEHHPDKVPIDQDKLRAIAERLQVGDTDEGAQALADYMTEMAKAAQARQPNADPADIARVVQDTVVQIQSKAEADAALERFAARYKPLVANEDLALTSMTVLTRELMKDLKAANFREEDLAANKHDTRTLAHWHRVARQTHRDLRNYDQLLSDVGEYMVSTYNLKIDRPAPSTPSTPQTPQPPRNLAEAAQARLERKRALPQQPRSASVRHVIDTAPKPKTRDEVLADMRKARGYRPIA